MKEKGAMAEVGHCHRAAGDGLVRGFDGMVAGLCAAAKGHLSKAGLVGGWCLFCAELALERRAQRIVALSKINAMLACLAGHGSGVGWSPYRSALFAAPPEGVSLQNLPGHLALPGCGLVLRSP